MKYIHIAYQSNNNWGYEVWNSINRQVDKGNVRALSNELKDEIGSLVLAFSYKWDYLLIIIERLDKKVDELIEAVKKEDQLIDNYAIEIEDAVKYPIIIDVNSFLHEIYSGLCVLDTLYQRVLIEVLNKTPENKIFSKLLERHNNSQEWLIKFYENRGHFTHAGTPWFALSTENDQDFEILILKENIKDFSDPDTYIRFGALNDYVHGLMYLAVRIQEHIVKEVDGMGEIVVDTA